MLNRITVARMLTVLMKNISIPITILWQKSIVDTNTNTAFEKYCQYQHQYFCDSTECTTSVNCFCNIFAITLHSQ